MPAFTTALGAGILGALGVTGSMAVGAAPFATAVGIGALGAAGYGAYTAGAAMTKGSKAEAPQVQPLPTAPTPADAKESAQAAVEKEKRIRALAGGKTLLTSQQPTLGGTSGKSLLGS